MDTKASTDKVLERTVDTQTTTDKILERAEQIFAAVIAPKREENSSAQLDSGPVVLSNSKEEDFLKLAVELGQDKAEAMRRYFAESTIFEPLGTENSDVGVLETLDPKLYSSINQHASKYTD